jgi:haloacetate dehalogenase
MGIYNDRMLFEGFSLSRIELGEVTLRVRHGGNGPPLLLLHGHPQTHMMWHALAPRLAREFTVIAPDLRGYGESSKPESTSDHMPYSKRVMAQDQVALMQYFGFEQFSVAGHDRGGRCAYRLSLDHPERVRKLAVLDIIPTGEAFRRANMTFGLGYWHWFFLAQPFPLPERLIGANPDNYYFRSGRERFHPEALADYLRGCHDPETIHAMCEDYRAAATIDYQLDEADRGVKRIQCPLLVLWSKKDFVAEWYDVLSVWRDWADDVRGEAIEGSHHFPEETPEATFRAMHQFFTV